MINIRPNLGGALMKTIRITVEEIEIDAQLNNSDTAHLIWNALTIEANLNLWGDEIYFRTEVESELEANASDVVSSGDIAYWPPGTAFCIFYGPTPASSENEIRAASAVNVIGVITGDEEAFKQVNNGATITITKVIE